MENVQPPVANEAKVLRGGDCKERVVIRREGEGVSVEGERLAGVRHPGIMLVREENGLGRRRSGAALRPNITCKCCTYLKSVDYKSKWVLT